MAKNGKAGKATKKGTAKATPITITITPHTPNPATKMAHCGVAGTNAQKNTIWLDKTKDYLITFVLAGAHGIQAWDANPFASTSEGYCPQPGDGVGAPFTLKGVGPGPKFDLQVTPNGQQSCNMYRLDFNDGYWCDPIIVVG